MAKQLNVNLAFTADTSKAKAQLQDLQNQLSHVINLPGSSFAGGITSDIQKATQAAAELKVHLESATNVKTGTLDFAKLNQSIKNSGSSLSEYAARIQSIGPEGQKAFAMLAQSVASAEVPIRRSNALLSELWVTMKNTMRWQLTSSMLHGFMGAVQSATGYAKDLDKSLNNIRIVTGYSADQMAVFAEKANKAAKALSTTTTEYTNASLIYFQQGLPMEEVQARAEITTKMAHASGQSVEVVSDQLTALWNNFYDGSQSLEHFADVLTKLGAETASSSDEISAGLEKFAAIGDMIGLSYDNAAAALATVTAQTRQSADVVGTAFKTIFARIQGLSLGETLDDGTNLNKYSEALSKVGISIFEQNGELKDMDNILAEMGAKWETLSKDQQVALAQTVAGVRQYNQLVALMDNFDFYEKNLESAKNADGSLQEQADIYAESWQAASDRVRASLESIYSTLVDDSAFITILDAIADIVSGIDKMIDSAGGLKGVLAGLGVIFTNVFRKQITQSITDASYSLKSWTERGRESIRQEKSQEIDNILALQGQAAENSPEDIRNQVIKEQLLSQQELINNAKDLTDTEQRTLQILLDQQKARGDLAIKAAEELQAAQKKVSASEMDLYSGEHRLPKYVKDSPEWTDQTADLGIIETLSVEAANLKREFSSAGQSIKSALAGDYGDALQQKAEELLDIENNIENAVTRLAGEDSGLAKKLRTHAKNVGELADAETKLGQAKDDALRKIQVENGKVTTNTQTVQKNTEKKKENAAATQQASQAADQNGDKLDQEKQDYEENTAAVKKNSDAKKGLTSAQWANNFVNGANAAMSATMAISALSSAFDTLESDAKPLEKITSMTMSLGMAIPSLGSSLKGLSKISLGAKGSLGGLAAGGKLGGAALKGLGMSATSAGAGMVAMIPYVAIAAAAIAALVVIGRELADAYNDAAIDLELANETLKKTTEDFNKAAEAASALRTEFENYHDIQDKLKDTSLSAEELAEAEKEAGKQAKELIEKYKLFGKEYSKINAKSGELELTEEGVKKLETMAKEAEVVAEQMERINTIASINQIQADQRNDAVELSRDITVSYVHTATDPSSGYTESTNIIRNATQGEVEALANTLNTVRESMGGVTPDAEALKTAILSSADKFGLSETVIQNLSDYINADTMSALTALADKMLEGVSAIEAFNRSLLGGAAEGLYGEGIDQLTSDKTRQNLMREAATSMLSSNEDVGGKQEQWSEAFSKNVATSTSKWDAANNMEGAINSWLDDVFEGSSDYTNADQWLKDNFGDSFDGDVNSQEMLRAYLEGQGYTVNSVDDKMNGTTAVSYTDQKGNVIDTSFGNAETQAMFANMVAEMAMTQRAEQLAEENNLAEEDVLDVFGKIQDNGKQEGVDFTNELLAGIANGGDFDFSSLFGGLTESEVTGLESLTADQLLSKFGLNSEDLSTLGFDNAAAFQEAFNEGLSSYNADDAKNAMLAELGMSEDAFDDYTNELQKNNSNLKDNEELAQKVAAAQIPIHRNVKKAAEIFADNADVLDEANRGTEDFSAACSTMADALNDVFGEGAFDAETVSGNLETVKKAMEGDIEALQTLQDIAGEQLLINAGINIDEGIGQEINDWIGSQEFNDIEIGATLDSTGMTEKFNQLLADGSVTVDQMNAILSGIGFTPEIDYKEVPIDEYASGQQDFTQTVEIIDPVTGEAKNMTLQSAVDTHGGTDTMVRIPYIKGGETVKTTTPAAMATPAKLGGGGGGGGGGGKKSTPAKPVDYTKKSDVVDRYKEQDDALDDIQETLEDINKESERLYGAKRLKQMDKEQKALLAQKKALEDKAKVAKDFYNEDQKRLKDTAKEYGLNFDFDDLGNITNYTTEMTKLYDELHAAEEKMDQMSTKEAQDEFKEATVQPIQDKIEELKKLISQYDDTKELLEDLQDEIDEAFYAWQDSNYEELTYKLELKLEVNDAELQKLEYFLDKYSDNFYKMAESAALMNDKIDPTIQNLEDYKSHKEALDDAYRNGEISQEAYIEGLKEVREGYYENLEALIELDKAMMHYYGDTLDAASEELSTFTDHMEHLTSVFDHYMSLMEILGKQKDYDAMGNFLGGKADTIRDRLDVAKEYYEMLKENSKADEYWANYQAALAEGNDDMAQWWKEQWDAEIDALDEAQAEMLGLTEEWAEAMKAVIENNMNKIAETLEKTLTGGTTFDTLMDEFDKLNTRQEEYLTKTNQIYETNKLMRTASKALDETDNKVAKQKLKNFIDETKSLQENTQLSKYELEIQQAKYDLLLAEIALEEAQNAKSTVRLSQDSEGNFGYVYTADQDAIDNAQQGVEDADNRLYNLSLEGQQEYTEKYLQAQQEMYNELTALQQAWLNGEIASEEEYQRQKDTILNHYLGEGGVLQTYSNLYRIACQTDADAVADNWQTNYGDMTQDTETWKIAVNQYLEDIKVQTDAWKDVSTQANADVEGALNDSETATKNLKDESGRLADTITSKVIPAIDKELEKVAAQTAAYAAQREELLALIAEYEAYIEALNKQVEVQSVGFDKDTDYSALMNEYLNNGGKVGDATYNELLKQRDAKIDWLESEGYDSSYWGTRGEETTAMYNELMAGGGDQAWFTKDYMSDEELIGKFEQLEIPLGALEDLVSQIEVTTGEIKESSNATGEKIDSLKDDNSTKLDEANAKADDTNSKLDDSNSKADDTNSKLDDSNSKLDDTNSKLDDISNKLDDANGKLEDIDGTIVSESGNIQGAIDSAAATVASSVGGAISSIQSEVSSLRSTVTGMAIGSAAGPIGTAIGGVIGGIIGSFDTGGYTGDWGPEGKLAVLHEKELVLNQGDTANLLTSISFLKDIVSVIDSQASMASMFSMSAMAGVASNSETLEQTVTIHAEFPNATNHSEIEEAFNNLVNRASQYANRK